MIDAFEDPERAGTSIAVSREGRAARRSAMQAGTLQKAPRAAGTLRALPSTPPTPPPGVLEEAVTVRQSSAPLAPPPDPASYYRHARFGVVGAILLVLIWLWIRERRIKA